MKTIFSSKIHENSMCVLVLLIHSSKHTIKRIDIIGKVIIMYFRSTIRVIYIFYILYE